MDKAQERRRFVRVPEKLQILYEVISCKKIGEYLTRDISQGGVRFLVHDFIPLGSCLKIKLALDAYLSCEALVKIAWIRENPYSQGYEIGVEFISMPQEAQDYLIGYLKTCVTAVK